MAKRFKSIYLGLTSRARKRPLAEQRAADTPGQAVKGKDGKQYISISPVHQRGEAKKRG